MCTCIAMQGKCLLFGRNMDIEYSFGERVVLRPRGFRQEYKRAERCEKAYAMVGMAALESGVTVSIGAAFGSGLGNEALIHLADQAMYQVKTNGKDGFALRAQALHGQRSGNAPVQ